MPLFLLAIRIATFDGSKLPWTCIHRCLPRAVRPVAGIICTTLPPFLNVCFAFIMARTFVSFRLVSSHVLAVAWSSPSPSDTFGYSRVETIFCRSFCRVQGFSRPPVPVRVLKQGTPWSLASDSTAPAGGGQALASAGLYTKTGRSSGDSSNSPSVSGSS